MSAITLATLPQATPQQVFDQVATHLLTQGARSNTNYGCAYRTGSLKCAAGCLIADSEYDPAIEDASWRALSGEGQVPSAHVRLIAELQHLHDDYDPDDWLHTLACLARRFNLSPAALQPWIHAS